MAKKLVMCGFVSALIVLAILATPFYGPENTEVFRGAAGWVYAFCALFPFALGAVWAAFYLIRS